MCALFGAEVTMHCNTGIDQVFKPPPNYRHGLLPPHDTRSLVDRSSRNCGGAAAVAAVVYGESLE